jgi:YbgC/YbaW family acyl-CoA thioester hydrolase
MARDEFTMSHTLRVRWAEIDRQGVVFNAHYFLYFDVAIAEYWRAIGFDYPAALEPLGSDVFAVKATAEFHGSARYDELIEVCCRCGRIGRSSLSFLLAIYRGQEHLTSGELVYVHVDLATRRSSPVAEVLRRAILAYEKTPPVC